MPLRSDWSDDACSIARGIDAVGDPWTLLILRELLSGVRRFDALHERLKIAENILASRLKTMCSSGLATKHPYHDGRRTRFEYHPTKAAEDALPILHAFSLWGGKHAGGGSDREITIVCRGCGARSTTGERCSECRCALTVASTAWIRPNSADGRPIPLTE